MNENAPSLEAIFANAESDHGEDVAVALRFLLQRALKSEDPYPKIAPGVKAVIDRWMVEGVR